LGSADVGIGLRRRPVVAVLVGAGMVLLVAGIVALVVNRDDDRSPIAALPPEASHIHGLTVDPVDETVYVATHGGLFTVTGSSATRVGTGTIDLMGFSLIEPGRFYASGHPGPQDDLPNPVGLIESRDGGLTWQSISMSGVSDFHTVTATGTRVYGFDGVLRISDDSGRSWAEGDGSIAPAALAVAPGIPDTILATTDAGVAKSTDGGQSFQIIPDGPRVVYVAWADADTVWAVDPDGSVHASFDAGNTWERRGDTGSVEVTITAGAFGVTVATKSAIVTSTDGRTFRTLAVTG